MKIKISIVAAVFIAVLVAIVYTSFFPKPIPQKTPVAQAKNQVGFKDLRPGSSKSDDAIKILGQPVREEKAASSSSLLVFSSGLGNRPINVTIDESKTVRLIVVPVSPDVTLAELSAPLSSPEATLYGDFARLGFALSVYLSRGTAILANPTTGEVKERWYFAPTTLEQFKMALAPGYQDQPIHEGE